MNERTDQTIESEHWISMVRQHERSGLSVPLFCLKQGISRSSFYARRKQMKMRPKDKVKSGFIRLMDGYSPAPSKYIATDQNIPSALIPLEHSLPLRIQTPNGYSVEAVVPGLRGMANVFGLLKDL